MDLHVSTFFSFQYFLIAHSSFVRIMEKCLNTWSIYLVEIEMHVLLTSSVRDLDLGSMINFSTRVNKVWQSSIQRQAAYVEGFQHGILALVGILTNEEKYCYKFWSFIKTEISKSIHIRDRISLVFTISHFTTT